MGKWSEDGICRSTVGQTGAAFQISLNGECVKRSHCCGEGHQMPWNWSYIQLWATMCILGPTFRSFARLASTLNLSITTMAYLWCSTKRHTCGQVCEGGQFCERLRKALPQNGKHLPALAVLPACFDSYRSIHHCCCHENPAPSVSQHALKTRALQKSSKHQIGTTETSRFLTWTSSLILTLSIRLTPPLNYLSHIM